MIGNPPDDVLVALARLHGTSDWSKVLKWLEAEEVELTDGIIQRATDMPVLHQIQGAIQTLRSINLIAEQSREAIQKKKQGGTLSQ